MTVCQSCLHNRMSHDTWGCRLKCGCGVSIVYMTEKFSSGPPDQAAIDQSNALVAEADRLEESRIKALRQRAVDETLPEQLNMI